MPGRLFETVAEGVGFEPTVLSYNGFQDRRLKPLGHSSPEYSNAEDVCYSEGHIMRQEQSVRPADPSAHFQANYGQK